MRLHIHCVGRDRLTAQSGRVLGYWAGIHFIYEPSEAKSRYLDLESGGKRPSLDQIGNIGYYRDSVLITADLLVFTY